MGTVDWDVGTLVILVEDDDLVGDVVALVRLHVHHCGVQMDGHAIFFENGFHCFCDF